MTFDDLYLWHVRLSSRRIEFRLDHKEYSGAFVQEINQFLLECTKQAGCLKFCEQADSLNRIYSFWRIELQAVILPDEIETLFPNQLETPDDLRPKQLFDLEATIRMHVRAEMRAIEESRKREHSVPNFMKAHNTSVAEFDISIQVPA